MDGISIHDLINEREELKYRMWSSYVEYMEAKRKRGSAVAPMRYFEWLDHFGLD